ncbi:MAG: hypothetical protein ABI867_39195 [Kofleriaceae bacterium]
MKALAGVAIVAIHVIVFVVYVPSCRRPELVLDVPANLVDDAAMVRPGDSRPIGRVPSDLHGARVDAVGGKPGLRYTRYAVDYRGGFTRTVGVASLTGPFQDPAKPACSGRVVLGQRLLDDGKASPGTIAGELVKTLESELKGESFVGIGDFVRASKVSLRWADLAHHPADVALVGMAPNGYVRATATLEFDRINIPLIVTLMPEPTSKQLAFRIAARAELEFGNRVMQWVSDKIGGDKLATRLARRQIDGALITALAPPPPFALPGGHALTFTYCDGPPEIVDGVAGALPFAVSIGSVTSAPQILPPKHGPAKHQPLADGGALAIDLDLDATNALLYELWRVRFLDARLAEAGLDRRFNEDPIVTEFLSLRISAPVLALPPVLGTANGKLQLFADARVTIRDGGTNTVGRVWGGLDFTFGKHLAPIAVELGALELSCERTPTQLVPCYADLVGALRDRSSQFQGELTRVFTKLLADIFVDQRVGAAGLTADLVIRGVSPTTLIDGDNASLHLELDAQLTPK